MPRSKPVRVAQLVVRLATSALHQPLQQRRLVVEALQQPPPQQIPQRGHADDGGHVPASSSAGAIASPVSSGR